MAKRIWFDISGSIETPKTEDADTVMDALTEFMEENGWAFSGTVEPTEDTDRETDDMEEDLDFDYEND